MKRNVSDDVLGEEAEVNTKAKAALFGLGLIGAGAGLAAIGVAVVVPACVGWSRDLLESAFRKGREGVMSGAQTAAATMGEVTARVQQSFEEAAKAAKGQTVESR